MTSRKHPIIVLTLCLTGLLLVRHRVEAQGEIPASAAEERSATETGFDAPELSPQMQALRANGAGARHLERAAKLQAKAAAAKPDKRSKLEAKVPKAYESAVEEFTEAARLDPKLAEAHAGLGTALARLGRHEEALAAFDRALALAPDEVETLVGRSESCLALDRVQQATAAYTHLEPRDPQRAAEVLAAIKSWAAAKRQQGDGVEPALLDSLEEWIARQPAGG